MPYVIPEVRLALAPTSAEPAHNSGQLNFQLTCLVDDYVDRHGESYFSINEVIGALECAKQEFYRRVAAPYEDKKCQQNGDVYNV